MNKEIMTPSKQLESDLIAWDTQLPGLRYLLDANALFNQLKALPVMKGANGITVTYFRYKPSMSCVVGFHFYNEDGKPQYYFAKALTKQRFTQSWMHPKRQELVNTEHPQAPIALPDIAVIVTHAHQDPTIRYLKVLDNTKRQRRLVRAWFSRQTKIKSVAWDLIRYKPERRAVLMLTVKNKSSIVVRCANKEAFGKIIEGAKIGVSTGHVVIAGIDKNARMLATKWVKGICLDMEKQDSISSCSIVEVGKKLAEVHSTQVNASNTLNAEDNIRTMQNAYTGMERIYPSILTTYGPLFKDLEAQILKIKEPVTTIHGDFSLDQIIQTQKGEIQFIDWDRAGLGNPLIDLATFQARLELQVIQGYITKKQLENIMTDLIEGYVATRSIDIDMLPCMVSWALICLIMEPFRRRTEDWVAQTDCLLEKANTLFQGLNNKTDSQIDIRLDSKLKQLLCSKFMGNVFSDYFEHDECQLESQQLTRLKPNKRALIYYDINVKSTSEKVTLVGKYRNKGLDGKSYLNQKTLWENGFDVSSQVYVPEPMFKDKRVNAWFQRYVPAVNLELILSKPEQSDINLGHQVGYALAQLHQSDALKMAVASKQWTVSDELTVLKNGMNKVLEIFPLLSPRIDQLLVDLTTIAQQLDSTIKTCVHRDFYPAQVLVDDSKIVLLDFDLCCLSHPALDMGNYIAHVYELLIRRGDNINRYSSHIQAFIDEYHRQTSTEHTVAIEIFTLLSFARHIYISTLFSDRAHTTEYILGICESMVTNLGDNRGWQREI